MFDLSAPGVERAIRDAQRHSDAVDELAILGLQPGRPWTRVPGLRKQFEEKLGFLRTFGCVINHDKWEVDHTLTTVHLFLDGDLQFFWRAVSPCGVTTMHGGLNYHGPSARVVEEATEGVHRRLPEELYKLIYSSSWSINT